MTKEDALVALLEHPQIKKRLNWGIFSGLSGSTQVDYVIGFVEGVIAELEKEKDPSSDFLKAKHDLLRKDPKYKKYFNSKGRYSGF